MKRSNRLSGEQAAVIDPAERAALEGAQRKRLVELVVHDLRNPLSALLGNLELLREELTGANQTVQEGLDDCTQLTTRVLSLDALIIAKNAAGRDKDKLGVMHLEAVRRRVEERKDQPQ